VRAEDSQSFSLIDCVSMGIKRMQRREQFGSCQYVHVCIHGIKFRSTIQGDNYPGRIPGSPVLTIVLTCAAAFQQAIPFCSRRPIRARLARMN
jgi:hypothetical protein